jgi:hypothetical protein
MGWWDKFIDKGDGWGAPFLPTVAWAELPHRQWGQQPATTRDNVLQTPPSHYPASRRRRPGRLCGFGRGAGPQRESILFWRSALGRVPNAAPLSSTVVRNYTYGQRKKLMALS